MRQNLKQKSGVFFLTWHVKIIKNVVVEICVSVLLLGCVLAQNKNTPAPHMAQNKNPWRNVVLVVGLNGLLIALILIMPYHSVHWYWIIRTKWVMINTKYLSFDSFLIWNNARIDWCSYFKCHVYLSIMKDGRDFCGLAILAGKPPFCIMMVT